MTFMTYKRLIYFCNRKTDLRDWISILNMYSAELIAIDLNVLKIHVLCAPIVYLVATVTRPSSPTSSCGSCEAAWSASDCGWKEKSGSFQFAIEMAFDCAEC